MTFEVKLTIKIEKKKSPTKPKKGKSQSISNQSTIIIKQK
jgi:hypothetical protein